MNEISNTSILNLLNSTKEMIERCIDNQNSTIQYGYTEMSDKVCLILSWINVGS